MIEVNTTSTALYMRLRQGWVGSVAQSPVLELGLGTGLGKVDFEAWGYDNYLCSRECRRDSRREGRRDSRREGRVMITIYVAVIYAGSATHNLLPGMHAVSGPGPGL